MPKDPENGKFPKDAVEATFKQADASWREFELRQSYEWKVSFGLWSVLALLAGAVVKVTRNFNSIKPSWCSFPSFSYSFCISTGGGQSDYVSGKSGAFRVRTITGIRWRKLWTGSYRGFFRWMSRRDTSLLHTLVGNGLVTRM